MRGSLLAAIYAADASPLPTRPNILFLITDQQTSGALSCAGNPYVKTPNLDRLAARGMRFVKSYCTYPLCCPSRASLFTSRTPHALRIYRNNDAELSEKGLQGQTLGELFQAAGYETAYAGKWHLQAGFPGSVDSWGNRKIPGFDVLPIAGKNPYKIDPVKESYGLTVDPNSADAAIKFLRRPHSKPFLLVASILNPHDICGYPECAPLRSLLPADPAKLPPARPNLHDSQPLPSALQAFIAPKGNWSEQQWREYLWVYYRLTEIADGEVGRVLTALKETGLAGNTVVVFTSDHGEMMGSHQMITKQRLYEEAVAVPVIVAPLGGSAGVDQQHLVSGLDIMPTLLDYAGIALPATAEGQSLRPLVEGKTVPWRDFLVSEVNGISESRMVRTARYKYIVYPTGENREQFFDEQEDPGELKNLIAEPALAGEVARHRSLLEQWRNATHDQWIGMSIFKGKGKKGKKQSGKKGSPETAAKPAADITPVVRC